MKVSFIFFGKAVILNVWSGWHILSDYAFWWVVKRNVSFFLTLMLADSISVSGLAGLWTESKQTKKHPSVYTIIPTQQGRKCISVTIIKKPFGYVSKHQTLAQREMRKRICMILPILYEWVFFLKFFLGFNYVLSPHIFRGFQKLRSTASR